MEQEIDRFIQIWKGPFANKYSDKPRLSAMIRDAELDFFRSGCKLPLFWEGYTGVSLLLHSLV